MTRRKKGLAALALVAMLTPGCVTGKLCEDMQRNNQSGQQGMALGDATLLPLGLAADVALSPLYVLCLPPVLMFAYSLGRMNWRY